MASTSVRISKQTHETLKDLAAREHRSLGDVLDEAIMQYQESKFWQDTRDAYTRLREDPGAWREFQDELAEWDATLMDGLEAEPPPPYDNETTDAS
jgi:predicted transcriptional regulator